MSTSVVPTISPTASLGPTPSSKSINESCQCHLLYIANFPSPTNGGNPDLPVIIGASIGVCIFILVCIAIAVGEYNLLKKQFIHVYIQNSITVIAAIIYCIKKEKCCFDSNNKVFPCTSS
jgi:hypothetical protein